MDVGEAIPININPERGTDVAGAPEMDQDEPPRRLSTEGRFRDPIELGLEPPARGRPRLRRLPNPGRFRSLSSGQKALIGLLACLLLALSTMLVGGLRRGVISFVHAREQYQLSWSEIELSPPPPPWFRGGSSRFLDRVWEKTTEPRTFSSLDLDPRRLNLLFRRNPWVHQVVKVEALYPNRVVVRLVYRVPVGLAKLDEDRKVLVDQAGVMLPPEDVDLEMLEVVGLANFQAPKAFRHGEVWSVDDPTRRERIVAAARLSGFIQSRRGSLVEALPSTHYVLVQPFTVEKPEPRNGLYVQITGGKSVREGDSLMFLWEDSGAIRSVRELSDDQKWTMLLDWLRTHPPGRSGRVIHLIFTPKGVEADPTPIARKSSRKGL